MLEKLFQLAERRGSRFVIRFDSQDKKEPWAIKFFPKSEEDGHFFSYAETLDAAISGILEEIDGF